MYKILIIDDDEVQLQLQRTLLMDEGYTVYTTADGPQGITIFKKNRLDLVLLDVGLPSMSGIEVLKEIRRIDNKAKVILVTGYPSVESSVLAMQLGAWDYIQKPVHVEHLLEKVNNALHSEKT
ncbi:MAG: response regulator [Ignavibacteria bacterium]|nr:response regulator [Ignavibacteria bacterium]MBI3766743.1 response regulator [Ignavibacteriales bacterium]